jgi:ssRNA-specific RNase YbeY (16S rRNA maturation enzyme)
LNTPKIQISNKTSYSIDSCLFTNILKQIEITEEILRGKEISICLVTDKEIRDLNKKFFGRDSVTDVLTFRSEFTHLPYLGEIVINIEGLMIRKDSYRDSLNL